MLLSFHQSCNDSVSTLGGCPPCLTLRRIWLRLHYFADDAATVDFAQPLVNAGLVEDVEAASGADLVATFELHLADRALVFVFVLLSCGPIAAASICGCRFDTRGT